MRKIETICKILLGLLIFTGCVGGKMQAQQTDLNVLKSIDQKKWDELAGERIFFGHQSVGYNLLNGISSIEKEMPNIKIELKETKAAADLNTPVFAHAKIGKNRNPFLKCDDFKEIIETGLGEKTDIAFLKLCFVDISWETDIKALFDYYSKTIRELESKYPRVRFFSVTVPLLASETGILAKIKKLTGQRSLSEEDNIRRDQFNATMREAYGKSGRLFDLAAYEAIRPNGSTSTFSNNKKEYPCLASEWTSDGGHLNEAGEKYIAKELLLFLVKLQ